jgi:beta-N-acetylhexosaminidase
MRTDTPSRWLALATVLLMLASVLAAPLQVHAQQGVSDAAVEGMLKSMTAEERVGQLFLVTFTGTQVEPGTPIHSLITEHHVGGVVLLAGNDNFVAAPQTVTEAYQLISKLQSTEWNNSLAEQVDAVTGEKSRDKYIPLLVGISQEGGGVGYDQILEGLTPMPSPMAIGATWDPALANQAGMVLGQELTDLGFNLYFGPPLDVLDSVDVSGTSDLQTHVFGGDPFWVAEMGRAFVTGLHTGSQGRLMVAAKHFPGRGDADRSPEEEAATVRKSLEQLKQIELAPFFAVTGGLPSSPESVDALLVSNIRYKGLQGNIRATTRPVSFDPLALGQILALQPFAAWREKGGLVISDDLGSHAVRQFYDPAGNTFQARLVARDALLAGNDLIHLGNAVSSDAPDNYTTVVRSLAYFAQKYREDPAFALRIDDSVKRILQVKMRLYPQFLLASVQAPASRLDRIGTSEHITFEIARKSATLISPDSTDLDTVLPEPPTARNRMIFITDSRPALQCSTCPSQPNLGVDALQQAILRLYGPEKGGQVLVSHLVSHSFEELNMLLNRTGGETLEADLRRSSYVVISLAGSDQGQPRSLRQFLSERQDLLRDKRVILFSFGAPFYMDATDISKLTAYYGLYSQTPPFTEVAARLLYQEISPRGYSPVSIPGVGYDLGKVMTPDPEQIIPLSLDYQPIAAVPTAIDPVTLTPEPTAIPLFQAGDMIAVRTGTILDHNGHPVPDGTIARFTMSILGEGGGVIDQKESITLDGIGRTSFKLDKPGLLEIRAASEPAAISEILQLDVSQGIPAAVTVMAPMTPGALEPTPEITSTPQSLSPITLTGDGYPRSGGWLLVMFLLASSGWLSYWTGQTLHSRRWGLRWALCVLLGGLTAYNYLAMGLPGSNDWISSGGMLAVLGVTLAGALLGLVAAWLWLQRSHGER